MFLQQKFRKKMLILLFLIGVIVSGFAINKQVHAANKGIKGVIVSIRIDEEMNLDSPDSLRVSLKGLVSGFFKEESELESAMAPLDAGDGKLPFTAISASACYHKKRKDDNFDLSAFKKYLLIRLMEETGYDFRISYPIPVSVDFSVLGAPEKKSVSYQNLTLCWKDKTL